MEYALLVGTTAADGTLTVTRRIARAMRLVKIKWLAGDFADGVDATLVNLGLGNVIGESLNIADRTLLTLTNANDDGWYDIDEDGDGVVDQVLELRVTSGGSGKVGGCIAYLVESVGKVETVSNFVPVGTHSDGSDISSAATFTAPVGATKILMQALGQNVRYTIDGTTAPTTSRGFQLATGAAIYVEVGAGGIVKVLQEAATADFQFQWGR